MTRRSFRILQPLRIERAARDATAYLADFDEPRSARLPWPLCAVIIFIISGLLWAALVYVVVS